MRVALTASISKGIIKNDTHGRRLIRSQKFLTLLGCILFLVKSALESPPNKITSTLAVKLCNSSLTEFVWLSVGIYTQTKTYFNELKLTCRTQQRVLNCLHSLDKWLNSEYHKIATLP